MPRPVLLGLLGLLGGGATGVPASLLARAGAQAVVEVELHGVACTSAHRCTAVGYFSNRPAAGITHPLAERWSGAAWSVQSVPPEAIGQVAAISCATADSCTAVGGLCVSAIGCAANTPLSEQWDGRRWSLSATAVAGDALGLSGVSCSAPSACTASGWESDNGLTYASVLAERWDGRTWTVQSSPTVPGFAEIQAVSCPAARTCVAAGYRADGFSGAPVAPLLERWSGAGWSVESSGNAPRRSGLRAVSCSSADRCTAVGYRVEGPASTAALAEAWTGRSWAVEPTPTPRGATTSLLTGVSCVAAADCTAVGYDGGGPHPTLVTLSERWNGTTWTIEPTPNPLHATSSRLEGVSCASGRSCTAVGYTTTPAGSTLGLAERWNGARWLLMGTPTP